MYQQLVNLNDLSSKCLKGLNFFKLKVGKIQISKPVLVLKNQIVGKDQGSEILKPPRFIHDCILDK